MAWQKHRWPEREKLQLAGQKSHVHRFEAPIANFIPLEHTSCCFLCGTRKNSDIDATRSPCSQARGALSSDQSAKKKKKLCAKIDFRVVTHSCEWTVIVRHSEQPRRCLMHLVFGWQDDGRCCVGVRFAVRPGNGVPHERQLTRAAAFKLRTLRHCRSGRGGRVGRRGAKARGEITGTGGRVWRGKGERPAQAEEVVVKKAQAGECTGRVAGAHKGGGGLGRRGR